MRLIWTEPAISDRIATYDYIEAENPRAAVDLDERFLQSAEFLRENPEMGKPGRVVGTRELVVHRRYFLVDEVDTDVVYVLAVVHTSRQWPPIGLEPAKS